MKNLQFMLDCRHWSYGLASVCTLKRRHTRRSRKRICPGRRSWGCQKLQSFSDIFYQHFAFRYSTIGLALAIIAEATLSFLGQGIPPTTPSLTYKSRKRISSLDFGGLLSSYCTDYTSVFCKFIGRLDAMHLIQNYDDQSS